MRRLKTPLPKTLQVTLENLENITLSDLKTPLAVKFRPRFFQVLETVRLDHLRGQWKDHWSGELQGVAGCVWGPVQRDVATSHAR